MPLGLLCSTSKNTGSQISRGSSVILKHSVTPELRGDFKTIAMPQSVCAAYMCFVRGQIYIYRSQTEQLNGFEAPNSHSVTDN